MKKIILVIIITIFLTTSCSYVELNNIAIANTSAINPSSAASIVYISAASPDDIVIIAFNNFGPKYHIFTNKNIHIVQYIQSNTNNKSIYYA